MGLSFAWLIFCSTTSPAAEAYGVGIALAKHPSGFLVTKVVTNSPAASEGSIAPGDLITAVGQSNDPPVALDSSMPMQEAVSRIRGPRGSLVRLTIVPEATNVLRARVVSLVRGELRGVPFGGLWERLPNGAMAPDVKLTRLPDKRSEKLSEFRGKMVVLEFWATWCGPCLKLMPDIQKEADKLASTDDTVFIAVSMDENPDVAWKRLESEHWTKTRSAWVDSTIVGAFGVNAIPKMFLINREGRIIYSGLPLDSEALIVALKVEVGLRQHQRVSNSAR